MKITIFLLAIIAAVCAEPPVPSNQYLPGNGAPNGGYAPPRNGGGNGNGNGGPGPQYGAPRPEYGAPTNGGNGGDQDEPASYSFEWAVKDEESGNDFGHMESREGDVAQGKYYVLLPDGRKQIVEYTADSDGYHPMVTYEEAQNGNGGYANGGYPKNGNGGNGNGGYPRQNGNGQNGNGGYQY